jgi:hypothetical protein
MNTITPEEFTKRSVAAVADLGLFFAGMPDEIMAAALQGIRANLEANLADEFGIDAAGSFAKEFLHAVAGHRREIDGGSSTMSRTLN